MEIITQSVQYRALIFDDDETIRSVLWSYFDRRGYEVFTFPHPKACPICVSAECVCSIDERCADLILTDLNMPFMEGLHFLEQQIKKGCKCHHFGIMSGSLSTEAAEKAKQLGIMTFPKPFSLNEIDKWVNKVESSIEPNRNLANWFLKGKQL